MIEGVIVFLMGMLFGVLLSGFIINLLFDWSVEE